MDATISLKNVAQIVTGTFRLADFTVFVGPNNSGKSVAAICAYAACQPTHIDALPAGAPFGRRANSMESREIPIPTDRQEIEEASESLLDLLKEIGQGTSPSDLRIPGAFQNFFSRRVVELLEIYGRSVASELERCFGTRLGDLARRNTQSPSEMTIAGGSWSVRINLRGKRERVELKRTPAIRPLMVASLAAISDKESFAPSAYADEFTRLRTLGELIGVASWNVFHPEFPRSSQYLPAERSGILQGHRLLAGAVLQRAPYVGIERLDMPQMSGVITDFLSNILNMGSRDEGSARHFAQVADEIEHRVLAGEISIDQEGDGYPEISFKQGKASFPLHRVSSMVTELAPIILYLRHLLARGDLLILEEPESHLHPQNQLLLADALVKLRAEGLRILVTTHSDYFIGELSNAIRTSAVRDYGNGESRVGLDPKAIAASSFVSGGSGTRITPLEISATEGFDEQEIGRVTEQLYGETIDLEEKINAQ
jgi:predicted ATPase